MPEFGQLLPARGREAVEQTLAQIHRASAEAYWRHLR